MRISSEFSNGEKIPVTYTCDGENKILPLVVEDIPSDSKSIVVIIDDPDAPGKTWVHWVIFDIPVSSSKMEIKDNSLGVEGTNDFGKIGYGGPCPPKGVHRYYFRVYALNSNLSLSSGTTRMDVDSAMKGKILDSAELVGTYRR